MKHFVPIKIENRNPNNARSKYCHFGFMKPVIKYYLHFRMRKLRNFDLNETLLRADAAFLFFIENNFEE